MSAVDDERTNLEEVISRKQQAILVLEENRELLEALEARFPGTVYISHWYQDKFRATFGVTVKDLAAEMAEHLTALEDLGLSIEGWTTIDDPENRKRLFDYEDCPNISITVAACLAEDATCRIEVIGYQERQEGQYVTVTKTVPITQLVCA